jgi:hypothetical protein
MARCATVAAGLHDLRSTTVTPGKAAYRVTPAAG